MGSSLTEIFLYHRVQTLHRLPRLNTLSSQAEAQVVVILAAAAVPEVIVAQ
jgi:hypothetical protein